MCAIITEQITSLRENFLKTVVVSKGHDAFHQNDLQRVRNDDNYLKRFLLHMDGNETEALKMMTEALEWRKQVQANEISKIVKHDILVNGGFFPYGHDKDGCTLFVFKCKKYAKGHVNVDELKKCVIYWFEYLERKDKGNAITIFFDMEGCGLANMDMEFTQYLIGLFKQNYPFFLNYILIYEMPWILNAAFKIIKTWLPEKAVQKIKFLHKKDIKEYVPQDVVLDCWGGPVQYVFRFVPEEYENKENTDGSNLASGDNNNITFNQSSVARKVHFADGSPMSESPEGSGEKEHDGSTLSVLPSSNITFFQEKGEYVSVLELQNSDSHTVISYKLKTTSPEKFRVRPSFGVLTPGAKATIHVTLIPLYQLSSLTRDKFLVMSTVLQDDELNTDAASIWKETSGRKVYQHRLKCTQTQASTARNGNAIPTSGGYSDGDQNHISELTSTVTKLRECQIQLHKSVKRTQHYQVVTVFLVLIMGVVLSYMLYLQTTKGAGGFCRNSNA